MTPLIIIWTLIAVLAAAGTTLIAWLVRSAGPTWHPGDPLPHVPADAPIRNWRETGPRIRSQPATTSRHANAPVR
jgi:hypothetical protein